jgi:hypothetical protein
MGARVLHWVLWLQRLCMGGLNRYGPWPYGIYMRPRAECRGGQRIAQGLALGHMELHVTVQKEPMPTKGDYAHI